MSQEGIDGWAAAGHPDAVVVGVAQLTYLRIAAAADCVRAGSVLVATNRDPIYPTERGFRPGAGSVVAAIETASRATAAVTIGKPEPYLLEVAAPRRGATREAVMIGDALSDVAAGGRRRADVLMLTGVTARGRRRLGATSADPRREGWRRTSGAILDELPARPRPGAPAVAS